MGGLEDVGLGADWGLAWALIAAVAGLGLVAVAATLFRRPDQFDLMRGYNALAPLTER